MILMMGTTRHFVGTKVWKIFGGLEYRGIIIGYDHKRKEFHILYDDGDMEDFYHNEVKIISNQPDQKSFSGRRSKSIM